MLDQIPLHEIMTVTRGDKELAQVLKQEEECDDKDRATTLFNNLAMGTNRIQRAEFEQGLGRALAKIGFTPKFVATFFDEMDQDKSGDLSPEEFGQLTQSLVSYSKNMLVVYTQEDGYNGGRTYFLRHVETFPDAQRDVEAFARVSSVDNEVCCVYAVCVCGFVCVCVCVCVWVCVGVCVCDVC